MGTKISKPTYCNPKNENIMFQNELENYVFSNNYDFNNTDQSLNNRVISIYDKKNNNIFDFMIDKKLGSGGNGRIYKLKGADLKVYLAIKFGNSDDETKIAEELNNSNCNVLKVKSVGKQLKNYQEKNKVENYAYFMELADGNLRDLALKFDSLGLNEINRFLTICEIIRKQMICIFDINNDYVYIDMKLENILYKCRDSSKLNEYNLMIGDLGAAVPSGGYYLSTYPPYEHRNQKGFINFNNNDEKLSALSWELGILLLSFISGSNMNILAYNSIKNITIDNLQNLYLLMENTYGSDIAKLLEPNHLNRRSIRIPLK